MDILRAMCATRDIKIESPWSLEEKMLSLEYPPSGSPVTGTFPHIGHLSLTTILCGPFLG